MIEHADLIVTGIGLLITLGAMLVGGGIRFASQETKLRQEIATVQRELNDRLVDIRQKITEVEMFMRDNYIKRDSFYHGLKELATNVESGNDRMDARLIRMEGKIDAGRREQKESAGP